MLPFQTENEERKPGRFSLICLLIAHCAKGSLSFVRLFTKKQIVVITYKPTKCTKWNKQTCPSMVTTDRSVSTGQPEGQFA
jgi:hypothetical protein